MVAPSLNVLSLCSGVGALDLGVRLAYPESRVLCYVEGELPCVEIMVERFQDGTLCEAPVWSDLTTLDYRPLEDLVDLVVSGIPCQPYSLAGKRKGNEDERALWPHLVRIARECQPGAFFIENTPQFLKHAEPVWSELRGLGYEWADPLTLRASALGANHRRARVFLFAAHPDRSVLREQQGRGSREGWKDPQVPLEPCEGPWGLPEPELCRVDDGPPNRVDAHRSLGNAVVPVVAAYALRTLVEELGQ